jgi:hypothetical protein
VPPSRLPCMASTSAASGVRREQGERTSVAVPHASPPSGVCEVPTGRGHGHRGGPRADRRGRHGDPIAGHDRA